MKKIKLVIFDMDGLMFETGRLAYRAYLRAAEEYDFEVCQEVYYYLTGRTEADIRKGMQELYGSTVPTNRWRAAMNRQKEVILAEEKRVFKKPGLLELLEALKKQDCLIAVASSSSKEKSRRTLKWNRCQIGLIRWFLGIKCERANLIQKSF